MELVWPAIGVPPDNHWYVGVVPPFTGVAVNVTEVPAQTELSASDDTILTLGVTVVVTVMVTDVEVTVAGTAQFKELVMRTDT